MGRRVSRLTIRKKKRTYDDFRGGDGEVEQDDSGEQASVPDEARWKKMNPYGLFAINDKDGTKHRFKRGEMATILPQGKSPGDSIESHEYWVGKILEIRADAGSEDSDVVWAKVQWFYSPQDAAGVLKSLARPTTPLGKFERLWSDHWDFILPQTFNEVIPLPRLYTFPRLPKSKARWKGLKLGNSGILDSISTASGSTMRATVSTSPATPTTTTTTGGRGRDDQASDVGLEAQIPIGPDTFYWRYTLEVQDRKINPKPISKICLCSRPYDPDSTSLLKGVMLFCPRPTCRTGFHIECLREAESVWKGDGGGDVGAAAKGRGRKSTVLSATTKKSKPGTKAETNGKRKVKILGTMGDSDDTNTVGEREELEYILPRALRLLSTSPDTNQPVNLLDLVQISPTASSSSSSVLSLLQRIHNLQRVQIKSREAGESSTVHRRHDSGVSPKSKASTGSTIEIEELLVEEGEGEKVNATAKTRSHFRTSQPNVSEFPKSELRKEQGRKSRTQKPPSSHLPPLTKNALLATLFLLPSPFRRGPNHDSSTTPTSQRSSSLGTSVFPASASTSTSTSTPASTPTSDHIPMHPYINRNADAKRLLLELASQPLLRGAAYFSPLGPTGNINAVLAARRLLWEVLRSVGEVELSPSIAHKEGSDDGECVEAEREEEHDEEGYLTIMRCVEGVLDGWKEIFQADAKIIPPGDQVAEDNIVVDGLIPTLSEEAHGSGIMKDWEEGDRVQQRRRINRGGAH